MPANVLVVGNGGREHALAWKLAQSDQVATVYVAPGNAGTHLELDIENVAIDSMDFDGLIAFAKTNKVEMTLIGPEAPLVAGIVDRFNEAGLRCFGPSKGAAQLEASKTFTKDFLARHNIPTAWYQSFTEVAPAIEYIREKGAPIVVKADGLAAGKGVILAETEQQAIDSVTDMLSGNQFGEAGHRVVIEEFLLGEEASFIVMVDGENIVPLATSQDHKARDNGDLGPNTGGMGAYSPAPVVTDEIHKRVMKEVIIPTVTGMAAEGNRYTGFLYAGLMINESGVPKVLEYNCRFGDPETQPIMLRLQSDLFELCDHAIDQRLNEIDAKWDSRCALGVVLASGGYPEQYATGIPIKGLPEQDEADVKVFHAGTTETSGQVVTNGGRVLCATALGNSVAEAQQKAYQAVNKIDWQDVYYRTDIGYRAIERESSS